MLPFWKHCLPLTLISSSLLSLSVFASTHDSFTSGEHVTIGDNVALYFKNKEKGQTGKLLQLPNGLVLSYGDLVSFGDFYEIKGKPIAYGATPDERKQRFLEAFNFFAKNTELMDETKQILDVVHEEQEYVRTGMERGEKPEDIYNKRGNESARKINCITGGGCSTSNWWLSPGRSLLLTSENFDHFGENAWIAYQTGHEAALEEAIAAHQNQDIKRLEVAYAMNAYACHFLTDRFAAGHVRTPREELAAQVTPSLVGTLLAGLMHNEESPIGLHVHNNRGDHWLSHGDKSYFEPKNIMNKQILQEAMQDSANQIFVAYLQGSAPANDLVYDLIPHADEIGNASVQDISPLFYWDKESKKLLRRADTSNLYDRNWTSNWWGWSTLVQLGGEKGIPMLAQAALIREGYGEQALQAGLITDATLISYLKAKV